MVKKIIISCGLILELQVYSQEKSEVKSFLPQVFSSFPNVRDLAISNDGNEMYFTLQSLQSEYSAILCTKKLKGKWQKPEVTMFSGKDTDLEPFFSADGLRLYFSSNRLKDKADSLADFDIWYVERKSTKEKWSEPINMGAPINTNENEFYPCITKSNNFYFTCDANATKGKDDIFLSKWNNGKYEVPVSMSDSINSEGFEFNAFVAQDESYMIYTCYNKKGGLGSGDLYISYNKNGNWTAEKNLTEINCKYMDYCPFVDAQGNLYFTSRRNSVKTSFDKRQTVDELLREMNRYDNGSSKLYYVNISNLLNTK